MGLPLRLVVLHIRCSSHNNTPKAVCFLKPGLNSNRPDGDAQLPQQGTRVCSLFEFSSSLNSGVLVIKARTRQSQTQSESRCIALT